MLRLAIGYLPAGLVRFVYTFLYLPAFPLILAYLLSRKDSRRRLREYFGILNREAALALEGTEPVIWVHAVSVGEVLSAVPVVERLREALPAYHFLLSTTIEDALQVARARKGLFQACIFLPLDFPPFLDLVIDTVQPRAVLISETDFWPNLLLALKCRKIPLFLINGRISTGFFRSFQALPRFAHTVLSTFHHFFVQTVQDYNRLLAGNVMPDRITVAGNTKYERSKDESIPAQTREILTRIRSLRHRLVVGGSTHPGEEEAVLEVLKAAHRNLNEELIAVIAPRNVGRSAEIIADARDRGFVCQTWTDLAKGKDVLPHLEVLVVDVIGQLKHIYSAADLVVIGGSFGNLGGHNFLEAAWYRKPILCGPDMRNFHGDVRLFHDNGGIVQVASPDDLAREACDLLEAPKLADAVGEAAYRVLMRQQGASELIAETILSMAFPEALS